MKRHLFFPLLCIIGLLSACHSKPKTTIQRPVFNGDSAYQYIQKQVQYGPRVPGTTAHHECVIWLVQTLERMGGSVEQQRGTMTNYEDQQMPVINLIAHFGSRDLNNRILLAAHYDTRPWSDEEEDYESRFTPIDGANDGASGVGVLLEVARQLGQLQQDSTRNIRGIDIVFFDCEDSGTPSHYTGPEREDTWCLGSQLWATNYAKKISSLDERVGGVSYSFGIVLDMVGAPDASFPREMYSTNYAANYQQQIWRTAQKLGYGSIFTDQQSYPITDDHYYINYIAGIPCVDIIHYDIRNATGFPHWWHTRNDNLDNISKSTLQAVGEVVMAQIK